MYPNMPQAGTLAFNMTKAGAFAERRLRRSEVATYSIYRTFHVRLPICNPFRIIVNRSSFNVTLS
ncbi:MAG: hypothetical protein LBS43_07015 [Prevotellaceae bacterium]|nr:hypothetical protein [Prevotellaceae bacterium]